MTAMLASGGISPTAYVAAGIGCIVLGAAFTAAITWLSDSQRKAAEAHRDSVTVQNETVQTLAGVVVELEGLGGRVGRIERWQDTVNTHLLTGAPARGREQGWATSNDRPADH